MLEIVKRLFDDWNRAELKYCHWKSNEHLSAGLEGKTDLDILIERKHSASAQISLLKCGFKRFEAADYLKYVSIEDYIGFDEISGELVHIHLHYEIVIGRKFLKQYHLPWEEEVFNSIRITDAGVKTIGPELELLLLIIRCLVKRPLSSIWINKNKTLDKNDRIEFAWLKKKMDEDEFRQVARHYFDQGIIEKLVEFVNGNRYYLNRQTGKKVLRELERYSGNSSEIKMIILHYYNKLFLIINYILLVFFRQPVPYKRRMTEGGRVIVFLGADGSGKTTVIKHVLRWLTWKINVYPVYFGSGDGPVSFLLMPLKWAIKIKNRKRGSVVHLDQSQNENSKKGQLYKWARALWAILLIYDKKKKFEKMVKARNRGMIVVCDRYPQVQFPGMNDGLLLDIWKNSSRRLKRGLSRLEQKVYTQISELEPDIIFKLNVPLATALKRKQDTPSYIVKRKIEIVDNLQFHHKNRVINIDTSKKVEESVLAVKNRIWGRI